MITEEETVHAKLSASGSKRWISCSASVKAEEGLPDSSSIFAQEGTAAHTLAERCLNYNRPATFFIGEQISVEKTFFEYLVDEDMAAAVQVYVDYCNNLPVEISMREKRVCFDKWVPDGFGTSDFIGIEERKTRSGNTKVIHVVDLKYGKGVMVDALDNSQAMLYGLGTIQTLGFIYGFDENDIVNCVIVQPRLDHISEFSITVGDLLRWADKVVIPAVKDAFSDNPTFGPGEEQCRWCKAKGSCKALKDEMFKAVYEDFGVINGETKMFDRGKLSPVELSEVMQKIPMIKSWAKAVEAHAFNELVQGKKIPGYKIVKGKAGNRTWNDTKEVVKYLTGELKFDIKDITTADIKTPAVIEKLLKASKVAKEKMARFVKPKKGSEEKPNLFWSQPEGNPTIAPEADKRDELVLKPSVESDFTAIN